MKLFKECNQSADCLLNQLMAVPFLSDTLSMRKEWRDNISDNDIQEISHHMLFMFTPIKKFFQLYCMQVPTYQIENGTVH